MPGGKRVSPCEASRGVSEGMTRREMFKDLPHPHPLGQGTTPAVPSAGALTWRSLRGQTRKPASEKYLEVHPFRRRNTERSGSVACVDPFGETPQQPHGQSDSAFRLRRQRRRALAAGRERCQQATAKDAQRTDVPPAHCCVTHVVGANANSQRTHRVLG